MTAFAHSLTRSLAAGALVLFAVTMSIWIVFVAPRRKKTDEQGSSTSRDVDVVTINRA